MSEKITLPERPLVDHADALTEFTRQSRSGLYRDPQAIPTPPKAAPNQVVPPDVYLGGLPPIPTSNPSNKATAKPGPWRDIQARPQAKAKPTELPTEKAALESQGQETVKDLNPSKNQSSLKPPLNISKATWAMGLLNIALGGVVYYYIVKNPSESITGDALAAKNYIFDKMLATFKSDKRAAKFTSIRTTPVCEPGHELPGKQKTTTTIRTKDAKGRVIQKTY